MAMILMVEEIKILKAHVDDAEFPTSWHSSLLLREINTVYADI